MNNTTQSNISLLLVEKSTVDSHAICLLLSTDTDTQFEIECTSNLESARTALKKKCFDVVLLDLDLPDSNGLPTFQSIVSEHSNLPIIVLSSSSDVQAAKDAVRYGAQDYLTKGTLNQDVLHRSIIYSIERKNIHIELKETAQKLFHTMQEVEYINKAKGELITRVSREIRSALNSIEGGATLFRSIELEPKHKKCLNFIYEGIDTLYQLINTTQFSNVDIGDTKIDIFDFNLKDVVEDCLEQLKYAAQQKSLELRVDYEPSLPLTLQSAPHILKSVLTTLISNSIEYTPKGTIAIRLSSDASGSVRFQIKDISDAPSSTESNKSSCKFIDPAERLGLAYSQKICQELGWELSLSNDENECAQFCLRIQDQKKTIATDKQEDEDPTQHKNTSRLYPLKILVAEDSLNSRKIAKAILNLIGYEPAFVNDGIEAVEAYKQEIYDLVLMDIDMPEMDGLSAANIIRERNPNHPPYIVALTASATADDRTQCIEAGLNEHIAKPIAIQKLLPIIRNAYNHKVHSAKAC